MAALGIGTAADVLLSYKNGAHILTLRKHWTSVSPAKAAITHHEC
jgi:hypothetical protein